MESVIESLPIDADRADEIDRRGFVVLDAASIGSGNLERLGPAYDRAVASADPNEVRVSADNVRALDLVSAGPEFDRFYVAPALLALAFHVLRAPFKLSSLHARTVLPCDRNAKLHTDWPEDDLREPKIVGFIYPVDDFSSNNGATRFVPESHRWGVGPERAMEKPRRPREGEVLAAAASGSCVVFDGRIWHGFTANRSAFPRRSIQGAFIRRAETPWVDQRKRLSDSTRARISPLARYVLGV